MSGGAPPHDAVAEQSVLGAMLLAPGVIAEVAEVLTGADFYRPAHELIYDAILGLQQRGGSVDMVTVAADLTQRDELDRVGGRPYLHTLVHGVPAPANASYYAKIVRERAYARRAASIAARIVDVAATGDVTQIGDLSAELVDVGRPVDDLGRRVIHLARADSVRAERVRWAWDRRIPLGALSLLAGREGLGKSTLAVDLAAQVTRGDLDGELIGRPMSVLYVATEDSHAHTVVPRLHVAGADLTRVHLLDAVLDADGTTDRLTIPGDAAILAEAIREHDVALVVLDAATSVLDGRLDGDRDRQMRRALEPLAGVGMDTGAAIIGIVHLGKAATADVGRAILGSIAWSQVARSVLAVAQDPDSGSLIITRTKCNLAGPVSSLGARIVPRPIALDDGATTEVGGVEWLGETSADVRDLLAEAAGGPQDDQEEVSDHAAIVIGILEEAGGTANRRDVIAAAKTHRLTESQVRRAWTAIRKAGKGRSVQRGLGEGGEWALATDSQPAHAAQADRASIIPDQAQAAQLAQPAHETAHDTAASTTPAQAAQAAQAGNDLHGSLRRQPAQHAQAGDAGQRGDGEDCPCGRPLGAHPGAALGPCRGGCGAIVHAYGDGAAGVCSRCRSSRPGLDLIESADLRWIDESHYLSEGSLVCVRMERGAHAATTTTITAGACGHCGATLPPTEGAP